MRFVKVNRRGMLGKRPLRQADLTNLVVFNSGDLHQFRSRLQAVISRTTIQSASAEERREIAVCAVFPVGKVVVGVKTLKIDTTATDTTRKD